MSLRRMLPFILINIVVSAVVVLAILFWWDNRGAQPDEVAAPETAVATPFPAVATAEAAAAAIPEVTEAPAPDPNEPLVHTVQAGDTLMNISQFYDVALDDIITANNIANPNILSVGQQLVIPVGGIPTATPAPTATATAAVIPSPNPTTELEQGEVKLVITAVIGAGNLTNEAVQIVNTGSRQVGLLNWKVADTDGHVYTFDRFTLFGDGAGLLLHTEAGQNSATDLYWGLEQPIWESGELVTLVDAENTIQATFVVP
ncbi:MAG: lamin tail domain-containing protein [Anaerolinea sp.]|nr:lamin tail domain-containing protein [Anaerolinea sp.]